MKLDRERLAEKAANLLTPLNRLPVDAQKVYLKNVDAVLADISAQGFAIVPKVAAKAMKEAAAFHNISTSYGEEGGFDFVSEEDAGNLWSAMLLASQDQQ